MPLLWPVQSRPTFPVAQSRLARLSLICLAVNDPDKNGYIKPEEDVPAMSMVLCETLLGGSKLIAKDRLHFRPSVYALLVQNGNVLLLNTRHTGKYFLPGGAVEIGEPMMDALKREVREETGLEIEVGPLFFFKEIFFYHDPEDYAVHGLSFVYRCRPITQVLIADDLVEDGESEKPRWISIAVLHADDFQSFTRDVFSALQANPM